MKNYWLWTLLLTTGCAFGGKVAWSQVGNNMTLLGHWDNNNLPISYNLVYNEVFGWAAPSGAEYAILGSHQRTYFIEVTNPTTPIVRDSVEGTYAVCIHRDFKTYRQYCYGVADEGASTFQIIDMSYLPDSVHVVYNSAQYFARAHNIFIDTTRGRLYVAGSNVQTNGLIIFDIATNPAVPIQLASVNLNHYVHDLSVRNDTAYLNNGYDGLNIYDCTVPTAPTLIATLNNYPQQGYTHSCWLTEDGNYLAMCDETRNKSCKMIDVRNLGNLNIASFFRSALLYPPDSGSIAHNPLIIGNYVCVAYYHDGIQIWDIANPAQPVHVAGYDTYPTNVNYNDYYGAWGCYPFLPSGTVLGSDVHNGLFVLRVPFPFPRPITAQVTTTVALCSNAANGAATVTPAGGTQPYTYLWSSGQSTATVTNVLPGTYTVTISDRYGYSIVQTVTIAAPAPIAANAQVAAESCPGTADGEINLTPTGGTGPYVCQWNTGDVVEDLNSLTAGSYSVTITDAAGCVQVTTIPVSAQFPAPIAVAGHDTILCVDATLVQAVPPLQGTGHWQWVTGNGTIQNSTQPITAISQLQTGLNLLAWIVFDGQCAASDTMRLYVSSTASIDAGHDTLACNATIQLSGSDPGNGLGHWTVQPTNVGFSNFVDPHTFASGLQPGSYTFYWSITDGNCQAIDSCVVTASQLPFASYSYATSGLTVTFSNVSQYATSWQWDFGDGNTSSLQQPSHIYSAAGNYMVCLIASDTCGSDTTCQWVNLSILGQDAHSLDKVEVWPNPFAKSFSVMLADDWKGQTIDFKISDAQGRLLRVGSFLAGPEPTQIELGDVAKGLYWLSMRTGQWQRAVGLMKE